MSKKAASGPPSVPNFGRDQDMNDSLANLSEQEKNNGAPMSTPQWDKGAVSL